MGDLPSHSHWSILTSDLPTNVHPGLFSRATGPHTHMIYFQGRPALLMGLPKIPSGNLEPKSVFFLLARFELAKSVSLTLTLVPLFSFLFFFENFLMVGFFSFFFLFQGHNNNSLLLSTQWFFFLFFFFFCFFFVFLFFFQSCWTFFFFVFLFFFQSCWNFFFVINKNMCAMLWG